MVNPESIIFTLPQAVAWRKQLKIKGQKLVVTNGCFDILHRGHGEYLWQSRLCGDALLVLINSDASVAVLKGPDRPIFDEYSRAYLLAGLKAVDAVVIFSGMRCTAYLEALQPEVYVKGGDYTVDTLDPEERAVLLKCGAEFKFIPFVNGFSTTGTIEKLRRNPED